MRRSTEVWVNGLKMRAITIAKDESHFSVRVLWSSVDKYFESWEKYALEVGIQQATRTGIFASGAREKWIHGLSREKTLIEINQFRIRAQKAGFEKLGHWTET